MFSVADHLITQHDVRLVLAAALVCFFASLIAVHLFRRAQATGGRTRGLWIATAGAATGFGIWATHFVAMLAYTPDFPVAYAVLPTGLSLLVAVVVTSLGLAIAITSSAPWAAPVGGAILAGGAAAMHYLGMQALELPGRISWSAGPMVVSILVGAVLAIAAVMLALRRETTVTTLGTGILLALAIISLHFIAIGAVEITPDRDSHDQRPFAVADMACNAHRRSCSRGAGHEPGRRVRRPPVQRDQRPAQVGTQQHAARPVHVRRLRAARDFQRTLPQPV